MAWHPEKITESNVREAAKRWRRDKKHLNFRNSISYDVVIDGKPYPPKAISSIAYELATGTKLNADDFVGAHDGIWHRQLKTLGFEILKKNSAVVIADETQNSVTLALEGIAREITVKARSRSDKLRRAALKKAKGVCEVCGTNYSKLLKGLGERVLQVHHRQQLSLTDKPKINGIEDVAVVCANCHLMIHTDMSKTMPVETLRLLLRRNGSA